MNQPMKRHLFSFFVALMIIPADAALAAPDDADMPAFPVPLAPVMEAPPAPPVPPALGGDVEMAPPAVGDAIKDMDFAVEFDSFQVTPSWTNGGTVTLESPAGTSVDLSAGGSVVIAEATDAVFTVIGDYGISAVYIDGQLVSGLLSPFADYPFERIIISPQQHIYTLLATADWSGTHTIEAQFAHEIEMKSVGSGSLIAPAEVTVGGTVVNDATAAVTADHNTSPVFTISPGLGQCLHDVAIDDISLGGFAGSVNKSDVTISSIVSDRTLAAYFGRTEVIVNLEAADNQKGSDADSSIQAPDSGFGWTAYLADASYNYDQSLSGPDYITQGSHGESFTIPDDIPAGVGCNARYIVIEYRNVDGWLKPSNDNRDLHALFAQISSDEVAYDENDHTLTLTINGAYDADSHTLTLVAENGSVTAEPLGLQGLGSFIYTAGEAVTLTAQPELNWYFHLWQGAASGSESPLAITMDQDLTIEAIFVQACQDGDGDGYTTSQQNTDCQESTELDCNDANSSIYPGASEICGDGIDQDCSGFDLECTGKDNDDDGDGFTENQGDCDDSNAMIHPGAEEIVGNDIDEDCYDGDKKMGTEVTCVAPSEIPIDVARKAAPPLMMLLFDDSWSMSAETLVEPNNTKSYDGYLAIGPESKTYLIDYPVESKNGQKDKSFVLSDPSKGIKSDAHHWQSQWSEYNKMFFDPSAVYDPWPLWDVVAQSIPKEEYKGQEQMAPRPFERTYDQDNSSFPDRAFADGFRHADMDQPRNNTINPQSGHSWSYLSSNNKTQVTDLNAPWFTVNDENDQYVYVLRDFQSTGNDTRVDAIGLSTNGNLELEYGNTVEYYLTGAGLEPEIIIDDADVDENNAPLSFNTSFWFSSTADEAFRWPNATGDAKTTKYTEGVGQIAGWFINPTPEQQATGDQAGGYYLYAWTGNYGESDGNALYMIGYYDEFNVFQTDEVRVDQRPKPIENTTTNGGRWILLKEDPYRFISIADSQQQTYEIKFAHYFVWWDSNDNQVRDNGEIYLINIPGSGYGLGDYSLEYYQYIEADSASSNNFDRVNGGELFKLTEPPPEIVPLRYDETGDQITDPDELAYVVRQNFADWFSFYRNRLNTAKAAIGLTFYDFENVELGIHTINRGTHEPLELMVTADGPEKIAFLSAVYNIDPGGSVGGNTQLLRGYQDVGRYFDATNDNDFEKLQTTEGLPTGDTSVFWDANKSSDQNNLDDSGGECQRAYVIMITDGYYNGSSEGEPSNADADSVYALKDSAVNTLADYADYYYHKDLDSNLADKLPPRGYDDATHQHLTTYGIALGVTGFFDPALYPDCLPACDTPGTVGCPGLEELGRAENCQEIEGVLTCEQTCFSDQNGEISCTTSNATGPFLKVCPDWTNKVESNEDKIDDLFHASVNGRGAFLSAAKPGDLVKALRKIKSLIAESQGTAASVAINANKIEDDVLLFQTSYDATDWSGDIRATCLDGLGNIASCAKVSCESGCNDISDNCLKDCGSLISSECENTCDELLGSCLAANQCADYQTCNQVNNDCLVACADDPTCESSCAASQEACLADPPEIKWLASEQLAPWDSRQILTADSSGRGLPFQWGDGDDLTPDGLTGAMKAALDGNIEQFNYIRGYQGCEQGNSQNCSNDSALRARSSILGDFINAEPYYYQNEALGIDWLIAGANDGMLHVLEAETGTEVFNYIPHTVFDNLTVLTEPSYTVTHKFFVDGYSVAEELGNSTLLVGMLRKGGKGLFGLDLAAAATAAATGDLEAAAQSVVKWELSVNTPDEVTKPSVAAAFSDHLGYTFSRPQIIKSNDASASWLVVFGNGYESAQGQAVLFLIGLDDGGEIVWTQIIDTGVGDADPATGNCNGLSTPAIVFPQGDQENDYIYAGDLLGNLWKFDLSAPNRADWKVYFTDDNSLPQPLFTARSDGDGTTGFRQPITAKPAVRGSCQFNAEGYLITFGTGRLYNAEVDVVDQSVQSVYGIWDWSDEWQDQGLDGSDKYYGAFENISTEVSAACTFACTLLASACNMNCSGSDCELDCLEEEASCLFDCDSIRPLENMANILGSSQAAEFVGLQEVRQNSIYGLIFNPDGTVKEQLYGETDLDKVDSVIRTISDNPVDWLLPSEVPSFTSGLLKARRHVGWYFDLPTNGERAVTDLQIINGILIYTTAAPSESPCAGGGNSWTWLVDSCSGGALNDAVLDLNNDGEVDQFDYINIGTPAEPVWVVSAAFMTEGIIPAVNVVEVEGGLDKLLSDNKECVGEECPKECVGEECNGPGGKIYGPTIQYWRDLDWQ